MASWAVHGPSIMINIWGLSRRYPAMWYEKQRHLLKKIQDTRNIVHRTMMPQSPSKWAPWDLTQVSQSSSAAPLYFPESHWWSEISSLSKMILVLGKARSCRSPNLSWRGLSHLGDLMFHQKTMHKTWCMSTCVVVMRLPITSCPWLRPSESSE